MINVHFQTLNQNQFFTSIVICSSSSQFWADMEDSFSISRSSLTVQFSTKPWKNKSFDILLSVTSVLRSAPGMWGTDHNVDLLEKTQLLRALIGPPLRTTKLCLCSSCTAENQNEKNFQEMKGWDYKNNQHMNRIALEQHIVECFLPLCLPIELLCYCY